MSDARDAMQVARAAVADLCEEVERQRAALRRLLSVVERMAAGEVSTEEHDAAVAKAREALGQ